MKCNEYLRYFYSLLKWDLPGPALLFHGQLCLFLLSLVVLPTRWLFFVVVNWFFLATETIYQRAIKFGFQLYECIQGKRQFSSLLERKTVSAVSANGLSKKMEGAVYDQVSSSQDDKDDDQDLCENLDDIDDDEGSGDTNKLGMVAKLIDTKKERQNIASECCFECNVSFSSILKRRYYCRHCGNHFCSKCCNQKVPKSLFGATAPAAQTETVLVCGNCFKALVSTGGRDKPV